jgi:hypothetical protein
MKGATMKTFDMPPDTMDGFDHKRGAWVIKHLMEDLDPLMDFQAAGIVGNLAGESGIQAINEIRPLVPGSRGGWSWAQWTGPRRVAFEEHAAARGLDIHSDEAAYEFLVKELRTTERRALKRLRKTKNIEDATYVFEVAFERPSDPHGGLPSRIRFARRALDYHIFNGRVAPAPVEVPPPPPAVIPWWQSLLQLLGWTR